MSSIRQGMHLLTKVVLVALVLNFIWEVGQMRWYGDGAGNPFALSFDAVIVHCLIPALGDTLVAAGTFVVGWYGHHRFDWIDRLSWRDAWLVSSTLFVLAVAIELTSVRLLHAWSYTAAMPLVPVVDVGWLPAMQLATLTLLTLLSVSHRSVRRTNR